MQGDPSAALGVGLGIIWMLAGLVSLAATIWGIIDVVKVPNDSDFRAGNKVVWILVIVFFNCLGAIIYALVGRPQNRV
jgi:hypothetical protein